MMNQAVNVLEQYDLEVRGVRKGRGCYLVNCKEGDFVLKEYKGSLEKARMQKLLTDKITKETNVLVQEIVPCKEGGLLSMDGDEESYVLQTYIEGKECNILDAKECEKAVCIMADMHKAMQMKRDDIKQLKPYSLKVEFSKHNAELRRVRRYLKEKQQKNDFERYLYKHFNYFFEKALEVEEEWETYENVCNSVAENIWFCHGDYQHHNVWTNYQETMILQFEKYAADFPCRDLYLFSRKLLEKNNWDIELGKTILDIYERERAIPAAEKISMIYRFAYPEKFWKVVNFYFNSKKSFMPDKNMEKLKKLLEQQENKEKFVNEVLKNLDK